MEMWKRNSSELFSYREPRKNVLKINLLLLWAIFLFFHVFFIFVIFSQVTWLQHTMSKMMFSHSEQNWRNVYRSSHLQMFFKIGVLKICILHRKTLQLESLFKKVAKLRPCNIIKKRLQHRYFPVSFAKFLRTPLFTEHLQWLLLVIISLTPDSLPSKQAFSSH